MADVELEEIIDGRVAHAGSPGDPYSDVGRVHRSVIRFYGPEPQFRRRLQVMVDSGMTLVERLSSARSGVAFRVALEDGRSLDLRVLPPHEPHGRADTVAFPVVTTAESCRPLLPESPPGDRPGYEG